VIAMAATSAGNLTLVGSIADRARAEGIEISLWALLPRWNPPPTLDHAGDRGRGGSVETMGHRLRRDARARVATRSCVTLLPGGNDKRRAYRSR